MAIEGRVRSLYGRRFCLSCSPFAAHNTSRLPPGARDPTELTEHRRKRRSAKFYRYQKKKRKAVKSELIALLGGRCQDCGYDANPNALEFHHLDAATKDFTISKRIATIAFDRVLTEARKCVLLCANCHRLRHAAAAVVPSPDDARRVIKARSVALMGGLCEGCGRNWPSAVFEFHHRDASTKEFGIGEDGSVRPWSTVVAELAKCVLLCANCHREVHAGVRELDESLLGLAEDAVAYAA